MNQQPLISVIVPVYNVEKYVGACIDSILNQSYENLEIILVDDGSTDSSGDICDEYAQRCGNIKVIHQANGGLSAARNSGLDVMNGEYVTFVDSDDLIHRECIFTMHKYIVEEQSDVASISFVTIYEEDFEPATASEGPIKVFHSGRDAVESMLYQQGFINNSAWGKLYKSTLFATQRFPEGMLYEDLATIPYVCLNASCIVASAFSMYCYRSREDSILGTFNMRRVDVLEIVEKLVQYMVQYHNSLVDAAKSRKFSANMNIMYLMLGNGIKDDAIIGHCWKNIKQLRKSIIINPKTRLKNKIGALASYIGLNFMQKIFTQLKIKTNR